MYMYYSVNHNDTVIYTGYGLNENSSETLHDKANLQALRNWRHHPCKKKAEN